MTKKIIFILAILSVVFLLRAWDDEELFKQSSKRLLPNVVILMDSSGTMNAVISYPKNGPDGFPAGHVNDTDGDGFHVNTIYSGNVVNTPKITEDDGGGYIGASSPGFQLKSSGWFGFVRVSSTSSAYFPDHVGSLTAITSATELEVSKATHDAWGVSSYFPGWIQGKTSGAYASVTARRNEVGKYHLTVSNIQGTFSADETLFSYYQRANGTFYPVYLYGTEDIEAGYRNVAHHCFYDENYVRWFALNATTAQLAVISHFSHYGTFNMSETPSPTSSVLNPSNCNCSGVDIVKQVFTRIQVAREVTCKVAQDNQTTVKLGLYIFADNGEGALSLDSPADMSQNAILLVNYKKSVLGIVGKSTTPLAESLATIWHDFKPGSVGNKDYLPVTAAHPPSTSLMESHCQGNYVIIATDGQSAGDNFMGSTYNGSIFRTKPVKRTQPAVTGDGIPIYTWNYNHGWGDYPMDPSDPTLTYDYSYNTSFQPPTSVNRAYCPFQTCWYRDNGGTDLLDDVAYFINHQDMFPDNLYPADHSQVKMRWPNNQNIITYTIGFNADNNLLARTAVNGDGKYYTSSNFQELSDSLQLAITDIGLREAEMMFTTFAAPKQSFTYGKYGYIATFTPRNNKTVWQGHLKAYKLDDNGDFPALTEDDWDAARLLAARSPDENDANKRLIYTVKGGSLVLFEKTTITPQDLGVYVAADDLISPNPNLARRDTIVDFIRGKNGYTDPYDEKADSPIGYKMGDIFHFNPLVVSVPLRWKAAFDPTYNTFYDENKDRSEVIYAGSNDGMIHCFKVAYKENGGGTELWAFIPPSFLPRLKYLTPVTTAAERPYYFRYFVDGKGIVKDIKVKIGSDKVWKTIIVFGMGIGGKTYCALDVTDPDPTVGDPLNTGPKFRWEFDSTSAHANFPLGCTEARPIIADINTSSETLAAVFLSGGVACDLTQVGTKPVWEEKLATAPGGLQGQALFTLNAYTGAVIHKLTYGTSGWNGTNTLTRSDLLYQIAAPPSLLDKNNDGIADLLYFFETGSYQATNQDTGGRMWRMNVLGNPSTWIPNKIYQAPATQTLYLGATLGFDKENHLWALFGSGRRPDITATTTQGNTTTFSNPSGQFVALMDDFSVPGTPYTNTNLKDITTWFTTLPTDASFSMASYKGFFFNFESYVHEIFYEPSPLFLNNIVYLNTFSPWTPPPDPNGEIDLCETPPVTGFHQVYKFTLAANGSNISIPSASDFAGKILGFGLLSSGKYKIYFGGSTPGGFQIDTPETISLDDIFGPVVWKENKK